MSRSGSRKSRAAKKTRAKSAQVKAAQVAVVVVKPIVAKARRATKTARKSPLAKSKLSRGPVAPSPLSPLPTGTERGTERQHLEPQELDAFFRALTPTVAATNERFWRAYFFLQFHYALKLSEPALIREADINVKKKKIKVKRLKKGPDPVDGDAQREARAKAARIAKGVKRWRRSDDAEGYDECVYDATNQVLDAVNVVREWKREKEVVENPFLFASNRQRKYGEIGVERLSQLRNDSGWQSVSRFTAWREFQKFARQAGWPEHLRNAHVLRHTRAVFMLAAGVPLQEVCTVLGHSALKMTERYVPAANALREKYGDTLKKLTEGASDRVAAGEAVA